MKYKVVILANENIHDHLIWLRSCEKFKDFINYRVVNLTSATWFSEINIEKVDFFLVKPGGFTSHYKQLYDERLFIIANTLGYKVFPSLEEVLIYENKRFLSLWLQANDIPHPETFIFYSRSEAKHFLGKTSFPIVAKLNIGASGHGVEIIKDTKRGERYIDQIFSKGMLPSLGPRLRKGNIIKRIFRKATHLSELKERLETYSEIRRFPQKGFCLFQTFIPHTYEWRVVRIGNSFYAHKKVVKGDKASGSLIKEYCNPPLRLLSFVKDVTDKYNFYSQAIDIFETKNGQYLINEMQCIFGQSDPYQMLVDNKPGRYLWRNNQWVFEEGLFNSNECFDERLEFIISMLSNRI